MPLFGATSKKSHFPDDPKHAVQIIGHHFSSEFKKNNDDEPKTNCCISLFNRAKSIKIPKPYQDIINWLTALASQSTITTEIIGSALSLSLRFASSQVVGDAATQIAAAALEVVINNIMNQFSLKIDVTPDYSELAQFCQDNQVTIPDELEALLQEAGVEIEVIPASTPA